MFCTFQSHEAEFDYLKSLEIEEKINQIKWLKKKSAANFILSTNDKTIKLWKISERYSISSYINHITILEKEELPREIIIWATSMVQSKELQTN